MSLVNVVPNEDCDVLYRTCGCPVLYTCTVYLIVVCGWCVVLHAVKFCVIMVIVVCGAYCEDGWHNVVKDKFDNV